MAPTVFCECCQRDITVTVAIPQVGDLIICDCGAQLRLAVVVFEPKLEAVLHRAPPGFNDDDMTPVEVPVAIPTKRK